MPTCKFKNIPSVISEDNVNLSVLVIKLDGLSMCSGQPDVHLIKMVAVQMSIVNYITFDFVTYYKSRDGPDCPYM